MTNPEVSAVLAPTNAPEVNAFVSTITDKRYRSRKWVGFLVLTIGTAVFTWFGKDMGSWMQWATIGYPVFCAANAALKWKGVEA